MGRKVEGVDIEDVFADLPTLETARLLLRPMRMEDADDMFAYASDPEVARYTTWEEHHSVEDSKLFLANMIESYRQHKVASWGLVHKGDGRLIGTCGFASWSTYHASAEIGYAMSRHYWGQGLMTEAVGETVRFGFTRMGLNRIEALCLPENLASARVMEKAGMSYEGLLREHLYAKGNYHDLKIYSILRREWQAGG